MSGEMGYIDNQLKKLGESLADLDWIDSIEKMTGYVRSAIQSDMIVRLADK